jgi:hypothetical protein
MANTGNLGEDLTVSTDFPGLYFSAKNKGVGGWGYRRGNTIQRVVVAVRDEYWNLASVKLIETIAKTQLCPKTLLGGVVYVPGYYDERSATFYADCDNFLPGPEGSFSESFRNCWGFSPSARKGRV